jgi:hypothetical protein
MRFIKRLDIRLDYMLKRTGRFKPLVAFLILWALGLIGIVAASLIIKGIIAVFALIFYN